MRSKAQRLQEEFRMVGVDTSGAKIHLPPMSLKPPSLDRATFFDYGKSAIGARPFTLCWAPGAL